MPFGLTNAPAAFQHLMNDIFRDILNIYVTIYLDGILIYSKNALDHDLNVKEVLKRLKENKLYASLKKCEFDKEKVEFLVCFISNKGLEMHPGKIESIKMWETPKTVNNVQTFMGFANFYRQFIPNFSGIALPITRWTKKDIPFIWDSETDKAFLTLKSLFSSSPILNHANSDKQFIIECDASDGALGAILSQKDTDGKLHPVAFHSRKFTKEEINYEIHDKELLAIVDGFREWRYYLVGAKEKIKVLCDHKNLTYFMTTKMLNRRQARWAMMLADFDFVITYIKGNENGKADALSRRSEYDITSEKKKTLQFKTILSSEKFQILALSVEPIVNSESLIPLIKVGLDADPKAKSIISTLTREDYEEDTEFE